TNLKYESFFTTLFISSFYLFQLAKKKKCTISYFYKEGFKMDVALMITCIADLMYPKAGKDTVEILERFGCTVHFPDNQTCCGQPAFNSGYHKEAKKAIKQTIQAFSNASYVVSPSGS